MPNKRRIKKSNKNKWLKKISSTHTKVDNNLKYNDIHSIYKKIIAKERKKINRINLEKKKKEYLRNKGVLPEFIKSDLYRKSWDDLKKINRKTKPKLFGIDNRKPPKSKVYKCDHYLAILWADKSGHIDFLGMKLFYESMTIKELQMYLLTRTSHYGGDTSSGRSSHITIKVFDDYNECLEYCTAMELFGYQYMITNQFTVRGFLLWQAYISNITVEDQAEQAIIDMNNYAKKYLPDLYIRIKKFETDLMKSLPKIDVRSRRRSRSRSRKK